MAKAIKGAIYLRVNNPTLNKNIGKYNLPHIWDKVLYSISDIKTKQTKINKKKHKWPQHHNICAYMRFHEKNKNKIRCKINQHLT